MDNEDTMMVDQRKRKRRRIALWGVISLAIVVGLLVYPSLTKRHYEKAIPQTVTQTMLVDDDGPFCREFQKVDMHERVTVPLYTASIVPAQVPEEHFASDAVAIAVAMNGSFSHALELAADYDAAVQARCSGGSN